MELEIEKTKAEIETETETEIKTEIELGKMRRGFVQVSASHVKCLWFLDKRNCRLMWQLDRGDRQTVGQTGDRYMVHTDCGTRGKRPSVACNVTAAKTDETANLTTACNARRGLHSRALSRPLSLSLCLPLSDPRSDPPKS